MAVHLYTNQYFFIGLFDWKKDRRFFARFEEPASPEKDSPPEEGKDLYCFSFTYSSELPHQHMLVAPFACCPFVCVKLELGTER